MSKKSFERATRHNRVTAVFTHMKKVNGEITNIPLYDLYAPERLRRVKH